MKKTFCEKLKDLREDMDLNQTELGKKLNLSQRKISYIERNENHPSLDEIKNICLFFNLSADYFLDLPQGLPFPDREKSKKDNNL